MKELDRLLLIAAENGNTKQVEALIKRGANVNVRNSRNETPLHLACAGEHKETVMALYNANAFTELYDNRGKKPIQRAHFMGATYRALYRALENEDYWWGM